MRLILRVFQYLNEDGKNKHCKFFDGFGLLLQGVLGLICFSVLICYYFIM